MPDIAFYNMWRTETPGDRAALLARMKDESPALASKAGFVAMTVLECAEDGRVLVEGRWQSKEAFDTAIAADPEAQKSRASLAQFGSPEPGLFTEVFRVPPTSDVLNGHAGSESSVASAGGALLAPGIEEGTAEVNGQKIRFLRAGTGPALVLVHGYPESSLTWRKIMPELAKKFTVIAPDTRGTGQSSLADGFSLEEVADDIYELVKTLGFEEVSLIGQDFGVQIVSAYAAKHRDAVAALVVIESPLSGFGLENLFASFWHFGFLASPFAELLVTGKEKEFFSEFAFGDFVYRKEAFTQADIDRYIAEQIRPGRLKAGFAYYRALLAGKDFFSKTVAPPWTFPVLAIDGDNSVNGLTAKSFEQVAPTLRSVIVADCGHFVQEEQPGFLVETLLDFLPME
ncbi:pimeloyl-ACP methyl ester carboxylesterase/heme-degrading monooxygenase HmoA [Granulicella aggregans]|uniref:Pimeloyl-ACP methyl ester carboxylesterase/heme-degrading monooxygenase HmoA n=1 Tax=Granulicella aggregans TaxID=474949 RepID=A0A7W7ZI92_9BACT|nr:alpha/beta fold hydrolase [Granulicella aggregans]MBB5060397.1 pimeloyl-ACP methyl ester carboxylesterase/heme-degrading monooxygenase HmoA [Granulicella aggregans]